MRKRLKWGVRRKKVDSNPLAAINAAADLNIKKGTSNRSLNEGEIAKALEAVTLSRMAQKNKLFLRLCLFYGCRNGELRISKKEHFDLDAMVWTVPMENHKTGKSTQKPLLRPIIPEVLPLIQQAMLLSPKRKYMFTNANDGNPMGVGPPLPLPYNLSLIPI